MQRMRNVAERPHVSARTTEWIDRLAPDDPLLDAAEVEIPHAERIRPRRGRRAASRSGAALALLLQACGGPSLPPQHPPDSIPGQLGGGAETPTLPAAGRGGPLGPLPTLGPAGGP